LVLPEAFDMQILLPFDLVFDKQPGAKQLLDEGLAIYAVVREDLRLELLGRTVEPTVVICEIPGTDEE